MSASTMRLPPILASDDDGDAVDFLVFEFLTKNYPVENLTSEFFPLDEERIWPMKCALYPFMIFGYPIERQIVDYNASRISARLLGLKGAMTEAPVRRICAGSR